MVNKLMKMAGYTSRKKFEEAYPTENSFLEAFPQARPMMEQFKKQGGATDGIAFPQAPGENRFFNYSAPTPNIPRLFQQGGAQGDPFEQVIMAVAQQMQIDPQQIMQMLQQSPDMLNQLQAMAQQDPQQAAQALAQALQGAGEQDQMAEQQMMADDQGAAAAQTEEQAMMAYGGNPFAPNPLDRFVYGGMPRYADGGEYEMCNGQPYEPCSPGLVRDPKTCGCTEPAPKSIAEGIYDWASDLSFGDLTPALSAAGAMGATYLASRFGPAGKTIQKFMKKIPKNIGTVAKYTIPAGVAAGVTYKPSPGKTVVGVPYKAPKPGAAQQDATATEKIYVPVPADFKEYGGGVNPFNYGAFTVPMAYGGGMDAMMGQDKPGSISADRVNNLMKFIRGGIENAQMQEMMGMQDEEMARYGKSVKKKKG